MTEPRYRTTPPRWATAGLPLPEPAALGTPLPFAPRLPTRIHPLRDQHLIPAPVLRDLIDHTQRLVFIAAQVAAFGQNPDFSDVRTIDKNVQRVATLNISPFAEGSFVIPAELEDLSATVTDRGESRELTATAVVNSFSDLMAALAPAATSETALPAIRRDPTAGMPIGFIQTVEDIGKMLGRHIERVDYLAETGPVPAGRPVSVDRAFAQRATDALNARKVSSQGQIVERTGRLVSLDLQRRRGRLEVVEGDRRESVPVVFDQSMQLPLARRMGQLVVVVGEGTFQRGRLASLLALHVGDPEDIPFDA